VKDALCRAFCDEVHVRSVPVGLAVRTPFNGIGGEPIGFYIVGPSPGGIYHIEDDGTTVPLIEAAVADLESQTRSAAFEELLSEYNVSYDGDRGELITEPLREDNVPAAALKFSALLLRLQDLVLLTPERAASTFKEDALRQIKETLSDRAEIRENEPLAPGFEFPADVIVQAKGQNPVAIFLAMTEQRVLEAVLAQMAALYEARRPCSVVALLEKDTSVTKKMRRYASNRLAAMPIFEGDEKAAIQRIVREVMGPTHTVH
jgi:hypothetical protein